MRRLFLRLIDVFLVAWFSISVVSLAQFRSEVHRLRYTIEDAEMKSDDVKDKFEELQRNVKPLVDRGIEGQNEQEKKVNENMNDLKTLIDDLKSSPFK